MREINYDVPFYSNTPDDTHCVQAAIRSVVKYFFQEKEYSWEELERHTDKVEGMWTWTMAGIMWMRELGLYVRNIEIFDYERFAESGANYLIEFYGKDVAEEQINHTNVKHDQECAQRFIRTVEIEKRIPTVDDIRTLLSEGYLLICMVNARMLNDRQGYAGHSVVIKGISGESILLHDPGLPALENRRVPLDVFEKAWAYPTDNAKNIAAIRKS